ncbi:MAG TPA: hypothetical protein VMZ50_02130 [Phycisphaerae bacterium]|nr:hypothetical protein [Phycisphaerae bacterium]
MSEVELRAAVREKLPPLIAADVSDEIVDELLAMFDGRPDQIHQAKYRVLRLYEDPSVADTTLRRDPWPR